MTLPTNSYFNYSVKMNTNDAIFETFLLELGQSKDTPTLPLYAITFIKFNLSYLTFFDCLKFTIKTIFYKEV